MGNVERKIQDAFAALDLNSADEVASKVLADIAKENPITLGRELLARSKPALAGTVGTTRQTWKDCIAARIVQPARVFKATSLTDLVTAVQAANARGLRIRAVGSGHSFSDVAQTTGILIDCFGMNEVMDPIDLPLRTGIDGRHLIEVEAGIRVQDLNNELYLRKLALANMGSYDGQTIIGALCTGTHGSGISLGALSEAVRSMRVVDSDGKVWQIEPTHGITDPVAFAKLHPTITLRQDDSWFYACTVGIGCLGLVHSLVLAVVDAYYLEEDRYCDDYLAVKASFMTDLRTNRHYEVLINPYTVDGKQRCLVTKRNIVQRPATIKNPGERNPITQMGAQIALLGDGVVMLSKIDPALMKRMINGSLKGLCDVNYADISFKVLKLGMGNQKAYSSEIAIPLCNALLAAERISSLATKFADEHGVVHTSPFSLRFVAASKAWLSPQYGGETCMIELPFLDGTVGGHEMQDRYEEALYSLGGRPHWGQRNQVCSLETIHAMYPEAEQWIAAYKAINAKGTFDNNFTRRIGLWLPKFNNSVWPAPSTS